jgi:hypothetical protein
MRTVGRRVRPSWRALEARPARPELWLLAAALVGMLLVEVWQSSRMAELGYERDRIQASLEQSEARLEFSRAELERRTTRAELAPLAIQLGLAPADVRQVVALPSAYLADAPRGDTRGSSSTLLAMAERVSRAIVPEATARDRAGN